MVRVADIQEGSLKNNAWKIKSYLTIYYKTGANLTVI